MQSWIGLRTRREIRELGALRCTHLSVEHTLAGGKSRRRGAVFDVLRECY
jgi:hypothetical protein